MRSAPLLLALAATLACTACRDATGEQRLVPSGLTKKKAAPKPAPTGLEPIETTYDKMVAAREEKERARAMKDGESDDWVPAEFKSGAARWKDVGVYVDGQPAGFLTFGEMPIGMPVTWVETLASAEKLPGGPGDGTRVVRKRYYRFDQYLATIGVDLRRVKALHIYGPKFTNSIVLTPKDLRSPAMKELTFRFGANVTGKPIPHLPVGLSTRRSPDKIAAVMVYVNKQPPAFEPRVGFTLDGQLQEGVPYYGEPIRGGIRVYLDNKLAAIIKRQDLDGKRATKAADGTLAWKLADELALQGVDTSKVKQVWAIRDELRAEHWTGADLATMTFSANAQAKGGILLTEQHVRANAIALHTRVLRDDEIPRPTPDDDE